MNAVVKCSSIVDQKSSIKEGPISLNIGLDRAHIKGRLENILFESTKSSIHKCLIGLNVQHYATTIRFRKNFNRVGTIDNETQLWSEIFYFSL